MTLTTESLIQIIETNKQGTKTMNQTIEHHLQELGFFPTTLIETFEELNAVDNRSYYQEKGYFNDPRDENGDVAF